MSKRHIWVIEVYCKGPFYQKNTTGHWVPTGYHHHGRRKYARQEMATLRKCNPSELYHVVKYMSP